MHEPTHEQLVEAWQRLRRPDWPETLEELTRSAARYALVKQHARLLECGRGPFVPVVVAEPVVAPDPPPLVTRTARPATKQVASPYFLDQKRRAAGEREED